jgi:hypothetical protein
MYWWCKNVDKLPSGVEILKYVVLCVLCAEYFFTHRSISLIFF